MPARGVAAWSFILLGLCLSILGTSLPGIQASFGVTLGDVALLVVVNAVGYIMAVSFTGPVVARFGQRLALRASMLALLLGIAFFSLASTWVVVMIGLGVIGAGEGLTEGVLNGLVSEQGGIQREADLNLMHALLGVGAILGPLAAALILTANLGWRWLYAPSALIALGLWWAIRRIPVVPRPPARVSSRHDRRPLLTPVVWLLAMMLCFYTGVEMIMGTWIFAHFQLTIAENAIQAGLATSLYWAGITLGRLLMGTIGARVNAHQMIIGNVVAAAIALALVVTTSSAWFMMICLMLLGMTVANIYPAVIAIAGRAYPATVHTVTGVLIAASGVGAAVFPWLTGAAAEAVGLATALLGAIGLLFLVLVGEFVVLWMLSRRSPQRLDDTRDIPPIGMVEAHADRSQ